MSNDDKHEILLLLATARQSVEERSPARLARHLRTTSYVYTVDPPDSWLGWAIGRC